MIGTIIAVTWFISIFFVLVEGGNSLFSLIPLSVYRLIAPRWVVQLEAEVHEERRQAAVERDWNWLVSTDLGVKLNDTCVVCKGEGEAPGYLVYGRGKPRSKNDDTLILCRECEGLGWRTDTYPCSYAYHFQR